MPAMQKQVVLDVIGMALFILVLLVIAAMVFPLLSFHRDRISRTDSCQSNESQIGLATLQYVQDYDEKFPIGVNKTGVGWAGTVMPYIKSADVFHCPQDPTKPSGNVFPDSYALNRNLRSVPLSSLEAPPHTVMGFEVMDDQARLDLFDEGASAGANSFSAVGYGTDGSLRAGTPDAKYATGYMGKRLISSVDSQFDGSTGRHNGGANFLMGDGHVKFLIPGAVSTGGDAKSAKDGQTGGIVGRAAGTADNAFAATFSTQ